MDLLVAQHNTSQIDQYGTLIRSCQCKVFIDPPTQNKNAWYTTQRDVGVTHLCSASRRVE
jgi:hypothetical protein